MNIDGLTAIRHSDRSLPNLMFQHPQKLGGMADLSGAGTPEGGHANC